MANIKCAHCKSHHSTVSEVRECAQGTPNKVTTNVVPLVSRQGDPHGVPEGFYGLISRVSKEMVMFSVEKPSEGRWRGYVFVKRWDDDASEWVPIRDAHQRFSILETISKDVSAASKRYGIKTGHCGVCGKKLTRKDSRKKGIGPVCEKRLVA